ncbi:MAG: ATP-binding protein [Firmicutes bacterium]|nr:ATP-binding protein [Bacillota bacterium]
MPEKDRETEDIELSFPVNAAYVSAARLTASSIANRMNFSVDEIEDVKAGVSEACAYIIRRLVTSQRSGFRILFQMKHSELRITIETDGSLTEPADDGMSLVMIKALMDEVAVRDCGERISITLVKVHKTGLFER